NGTSGFSNGSGGGRGTTLQASIVGGTPNYLPVTIGVDVQQSQWQVYSISGALQGTQQTVGTPFTVDVRPTVTSDRMAADTAVNLTSTAPTVMQVQTTPLTIANNAAT